MFKIDIRINKIHAKEILKMFSDWDLQFVKDHPEFKEGYINATKDFLSTLNLTTKDLEKIIKSR